MNPETNREEFRTFNSIQQLKDKIIELKLNSPDSEELKYLLGGFANEVSTFKERLVMEKMEEMT
jgi:hypothetical protein